MPILFLTAMLNACTDGPVEVPGNLANPKLAELINANLDARIKRMDPAWSRGYLPQAASNARLWLEEVDEVVARCKYGPRNSSKSNVLQYDITLRNGEVVKDVDTGQRCFYEVGAPLVMRVRFAGGRAVEVLTDGRERNAPVASAQGDIDLLCKGVLGVDRDRRSARYVSPGKTAAEIAQEWESKKP